MTDMMIASEIATLRETVQQWKRDRLRVGFVPTMGALHEGHISLVRQALQACDRVIVSIFVNPTQFNDPTDLAAYPRTEHADARLLHAAGAHMLYTPDAASMYPSGFSTTVHVSGLSEGLCGAFRPGHFDGMATVVTKLLIQTQADCAFFGEKDFQQLQIVRRLVTDLDIPTEIVPCATWREADDLAMSSRNRRLTAQGRETAARLPAAMRTAAAALAGGSAVGTVLATLRATLEQAGFEPVEYAELREAADLQPQGIVTDGCRLLVAAWIDGVRLIDNMPVSLR